MMPWIVQSFSSAAVVPMLCPEALLVMQIPRAQLGPVGTGALGRGRQVC